MAADKEWSENPEDDPVELQKRQLELGKKFLAKMEAQEAAEKARQEAYAAAPPVGTAVYSPPTFEEISARIKKSWDEVERIMPNAPDAAKVKAFEAIVHTGFSAFGGLAG